MLKAINIDRYLNIGLFIMLDSRRFNNIFGGLNLFYLLLFSFGGGGVMVVAPPGNLSIRRRQENFYSIPHGLTRSE